MTSYFFDSYAIIEILKASENYSKYITSEFITTKLNLFEVYYRLLMDSKKKADIFMKLYASHVVDFDESVIEQACTIKISNRSKNLSMTDCIGYVIALKNNIKFLTGDIQFKNMPNVEYVK